VVIEKKIEGLSPKTRKQTKGKEEEEKSKVAEIFYLGKENWNCTGIS